MSEEVMYPYPGLRPFRRDESHIFFGREDQCDQLIDKLACNRFLAVVGPSGCGKSSLVRAGLIPDLLTGFMSNEKACWLIAEMRPGNNPLLHLLKALKEGGILDEDIDENSVQFGHDISALIDLLKASDKLRTKHNANIFIIVDQFEEIFRYREDITLREADAFVSLLLYSVKQSIYNIYVLITMRTDYLGDCTLFSGLPEKINDCLFLTPRLTREQIHDAIVGPARVCNGKARYDLVNVLIEGVGSDPDQLPLMQHALMRTYNQVLDGSGPALLNERDAEDAFVLTLQAYDEVGGLNGALSMHADKVYEQLPDGLGSVAEAVFRCLSIRDKGQRDIRNPMSIESIMQVTGFTQDQITSVAKAFMAPGNNFIMQSGADTANLDGKVVLDISHESLIRKWDKLREWVNREAKDASDYLRLSGRAQYWGQLDEEKQKEGLEKMPYLQLHIDWWTRKQPTRGWAARYDKDDGKSFELTKQYLEISKQEHEKAAIIKEEAIRKEARDAAEKSVRFAKISLLIAAVVAIVLIVYIRDKLIMSHLAAAYKEQQNSKFKNAIDQYRQVIRISPRNVTAHVGLAFANLRLEAPNYEEAIDNYEKALGIDAENVTAYVDLANAYRNIASRTIDQDPYNYQKAILNYKIALDIDPTNDGAYDGLNSCLSVRNPDYSGMDAIYKDILKKNPKNFNAYVALGALYSRQGKYDEAIEFYRRADKCSPNKIKTHLGLGFSYLSKGDYGNAEKSYKEALSLEKNNSKAAYGLGNIYLAQRNYKPAIDMFEYNLKYKNDENSQLFALSSLGKGYALIKLGQRDKAAEIFEQIKKVDPSMIDAYSRNKWAADIKNIADGL